MAFWYSRSALALALWPLSQLFWGIVVLRRRLYRLGWLSSRSLPVPVIVVGNISVGGSGKTPLVIWLVERLRAAGYRPGVVSRGYGGRSRTWPRRVTASGDPAELGDEPVLIAVRSSCPVVVDPDRPRGAGELLDAGCDLILADDGLQHYALERALEIAVVDGRRGFGNGFCLPAGPLREPVGRLAEVDFVVVNGRVTDGGYAMRLVGDRAVNLVDPAESRPLTDWRGRRVHALAGIGDPQRFFDALRGFGIEVTAHPFADHHRFRPDELAFGDGQALLMTEKDAVKCRPWACNHHWYVPVTAEPEPAFEPALLARLAAVGNVRTHDETRHGQETA